VAENVDEQILRLYRSRSRALVGYAMSWTGGDLGQAEELVDDAFHELYRQWPEVAAFSDSSRYGWLRRVTRNLAVSAYRKRRTIAEPVDPIEDAGRLDQANDADDPVEVLLAREHAALARNLVEQCMAVIQSMPEHLRVAILLRGERHTSRQIGVLMGVDSSTVRGYWKQAIKELNNRVGDVIRILEDRASRTRPARRQDDCRRQPPRQTAGRGSAGELGGAGTRTGCAVRRP
jgi:RNA polymerase sigma factor (sigma-70 family)